MRFIWLVVILGAIAIGLVAIPASVVSHAVGLTLWGYELPDDSTLQEALRHCQIDRFATREYVLCPDRLKSHEFPKYLGEALVASEDRQFYQHDGVDKLAIASSVATNVLRVLGGGMGLLRRGGSTVTQQLARILFLDERAGLSRKVREIALAPRIERLLTKQQILTAYMNVVPHAHGMNGFDAAARYFFGVPAGDINLGEAALLVGMLPAPNDRDPIKHPQAALDSATRVLDRMVEQQAITEADAQAAARGLLWRIQNSRLGRGNARIVKEETRPYRDLAVAEAARHGADVGEEYRLITYLDLQVQDWIVTATKDIAGRYQAAGVFIRPTGEVLGISGSRDYVESSLNRAFKTKQAIGSTGKLFVLIAAHENGVDANRVFPSRSVDGKGWPVEPSLECRGRAMSLAEAIINSCNRPFTWAAYELAGKLKDVVYRYELTPPDAPALVPLGGIEASPLQLARSYASVANFGRLPRVRSLVAALGRRGNVLYAPERHSRQVMTPETASVVRAALRKPVREGTGRLADSVHAVVYGKTGTTSQDKDALFVGLTNDYVGAFWIGDDQNRSMERIYGSGAPARAFGWMTDTYYTTKSNREANPRTVDEPAPWWRVRTPDFLQNRTRRYYILVGLLMLAVSVAAAKLTSLPWRGRAGTYRRGRLLVSTLGAPYRVLLGLMRGLRRIGASR